MSLIGIWNNYDPAMKFIVDPWDSVVREPWRQKLPEYLMDGKRIKKAQDKYVRFPELFIPLSRVLGSTCSTLLLEVLAPIT